MLTKMVLNVLIVSFALHSTLVWAQSENKSYILCNRDAEVVPANENFNNSQDPCAGDVQLQAISYACVPIEQVDDKRVQFLNDLKTNANNYCEEFCQKKSTATVACKAEFSEPVRCGLTVATAEAERFGKQMAPCNPGCAGVAFAYCSIYKGSFLKTEDEHLKGQTPNCRCRVDQDAMNGLGFKMKKMLKSLF